MTYEPEGEGMDAVLNFVVDRLDEMCCESFLDAGCGPGTYINKIREERPAITAIALDAHEPSLSKVDTQVSARWLGVMPDVLYKIPPKCVDAVICLDVVEHLEKVKAIESMLLLSSLARKLVVIFTPLGFMFQPPAPDNPFQEHLCGFEPNELHLLGFEPVIWPYFDYGGSKGECEALWGVKRLVSK